MRYRAVLINTANRTSGTFTGLNQSNQSQDWETIEQAQKAAEQALKAYSSNLNNQPLLVYVLDLEEHKIVSVATRPVQPLLNFYTPPFGKRLG